MRDAGHILHPFQNFRKVGVGLQCNQDAAGNPFHFSATAVCESLPEVQAQAIFKVVPVAFLEAQFVVVHNEEAIHWKHYTVSRKFGWPSRILFCILTSTL
jgi:hypothetical protein